MRQVFSAALMLALIGTAGPVLAAGQETPTGGVQGVARDAQQQTLASHTVQVRNVQTGQLVGSGTTNAGGQFTFSGLTPGNCVVEIVNAAGQIIGTTAPIAVAAGTMASVTVTASAAGALAASSGAGFGIFGMGTAASAALIGGVAVGVTAGVVKMKDGKLTICHKPTGQPAVTIEISESAKNSHMAHGDTLGACPASPSR
jgi:hypothetical protein